ncbi:MAG: hypothetical protein CUN54_07885 [Phototrophicales bacterium]|nr:MAG: hypothetical protein CUN54_07885 [Phototrophicales bacterium]
MTKRKSKKEHEQKATLPDVEIIPRSERVRERFRYIRPKLFVSYAHANIGVVNPIARRLSDQYFYDVWIDYDSIRAGKKWKEELSAGIQDADAVLFMMSPESLQSEWCIAELNHADKHNKLIIPLCLNAATERSAIEAVTVLDGLQYLDFAVENTENAWTKLIRQLHDAGIKVPRREIQLLENPTLQRLHQEYLRRLFNEFSAVDLTYLLDAKPEKPISLLDVYVPLRLGVDFNVDVENGEYVDWWLREVDKPVEKPEDESIREIEKPKALNGFAPDEDTIPAWEQRLKEGWARFKARHEEREAEKDEDKREALKDGTYRWGRIESETAPALMKYLVITGDPGSGKSTLLRHIALAMVGQQIRPVGDVVVKMVYLSPSKVTLR